MLYDKYPIVLDRSLAKVLGLNEALVLQQVHYWIELNKKNKRNFHEGRYWTYNTYEAWAEEFPFWSTVTIKRIFKRLREANIIITGNFNVYQMDRTLWYTINYHQLERLMKEYGYKVDTSESIVVKNNETMESDRTHNDTQSEPMEEVTLTPAIPETTSEITADVYNHSIGQSAVESIEDSGQSDRLANSTNEFQEKYDKIVEKCELHSIDEKYRDAVAHAIRLLLLDTEKPDKIKLGNNYIPAEMVERDIHKLNFFVIQHAINKFKEASAVVKIRNTIAYLKTCIYNAIGEMNIDIDSRLRYDQVIW